MSQGNVRGLCKLYDVVETQVHGLKSLGVNSDTYGSLLSSVIIRKIPLELQLLLSREVGDRSWELDDLFQRLHGEIAARERLGTVTPHHDPKPSKPLSTGATLLASGQGIPTCCYCQNPHPSHTCRTVSSVEDKRSVIREHGRCFVCLKRGHMSRQCKSNSHCQGCCGRHHLSICAKKDESERQPSPTSPSSVGDTTS